MAKKTLNPADAYRKAQRKKELKKNKTERAKTRDFALVKKDTSELEEEIERLEEEAKASGKADPRLSQLKSELEKISEKKAEYVEEHPEARRLVYKGRRKEGEKVEEEKPIPASRNMFDKKGLPRHPERSIYYDPVMNPYGVPPPGMPYMERSLLPGEANSDAEMDNDDDIPLPPGPPPGFEEVGEDEDIPLPDGPPPGKEETTHPPLPPGPPPPESFLNPSLIPQGVSYTPAAFPNEFPPPPPPPGFPPSAMPGLPPPPPGIPPPLIGFPPSVIPSLPPPPPGMTLFSAGFPSSTMPGLLPPPPGMPPPPSGFPPHMMGAFPPPPPGHPPNFLPNFPPQGVPFHSQSLPPPPPGFFPRKTQTSSSLQDPLSSIPHQTYQAHRAAQLASAPHPSLPPKPTAASVTANATVVAAPQLRDFKKEATAFVPAALKRKKAATSGPPPSAINAAPSVGGSGPESPGDNVDAGPARPDLVSALKSRFPVPAPKSKSKPKDDYIKFVEEMGDILG